MKNIKRNIMIILIMIITIFNLEISTRCDNENKQGVLILYDSLAKDTEHEGNLELVVKLINAFGKSSSVKEVSKYEDSLVKGYKYIVFIRNGDQIPDNSDVVIRDIKIYNKPLLYIGRDIKTILPSIKLDTVKVNNTEVKIQVLGLEGKQFFVKEIEFIKNGQGSSVGVITNQSYEKYPFGISIDNIFYVPYITTNNISEIALAKVLQDYFSIKESGRFYLFIKEIYPFSDLNMLCKMSDEFCENGIPFICGVMPIFQNMDYPAIKRYAQVLRYVQSNGGTIVIEEPNVRENEIEKETLTSNIARFIDYLVAYDVIPLGVGVHASRLCNNYYKENLFKFFSTNILLVDKNSALNYTGDYYAFKKAIYGIDYEMFNRIHPISKKSFFEIPLDIAIQIDIANDENEINSVTKMINDRWVPITDYRQINQTVQTNNNQIKSNDGLVFLNNKEKNFEYKEKPLQITFEKRHSQFISLEKTFIIGNKILVTVVVVSLLIFSVLILMGIQLYRNKFMK